jgi:hypothetical protein
MCLEPWPVTNRLDLSLLGPCHELHLVLCDHGVWYFGIYSMYTIHWINKLHPTPVNERVHQHRDESRHSILA